MNSLFIRYGVMASQKTSGGVGGYVTFENEDGTTISVTPKWSKSDVELQYSFNGTTWVDISAPTFTPGEYKTPTSYSDLTEIVNTTGNKIYFRGKAPTNKSLFTGNYSVNAWACADTTKITGNLNFLLCDDLGDTTAPTALDDYAFTYMFYGCTSLETAPDLPATTLADYCYYFMFDGCTSLETAPELPATTLADYCYAYMFRNCTSLDTAPGLPATTLAESCYRYMFYGCTSLVTAPELPATDLADYCYAYMFRNCTSLVTAPDLPATTLAESCYRYMFYGCTSLTSITLSYAGTTTAYTGNWVSGITTTGTLYKAGTQYSSSGNDTYPSTWTQLPISYVTFENEDGPTISVTPKWTTSNVVIQYSFDATSWSNATSETEIVNTTGNKIYFRGKAPTTKSLFTSHSSSNKWVCADTTKITGNLNFLLCDDLGDPTAPTTLDGYSFNHMFYGCTSLVTAPDLPATTLAEDCYRSMFAGCTSLVTAPDLPAKTLADSCYYSMFDGCTSLTSIAIYYEGDTTSYTRFWVNGITTTGTLYKAGTQYSSSGNDTYPSTWTQLPATIPYVTFENEDGPTISVTPKWTTSNVVIQYSFDATSWSNATSETEIVNTTGNKIYFRGKAPTNKSLFTESDLANAWTCADATKITGNLNFLLCDDLGHTTAPTTLDDYAFTAMFYGCTSLTTAPDLPATTLADYCYRSMFAGCTSLVTAPELPATTLADYCYYFMFDGCTSLDTAPELPATTLKVSWAYASYCYAYMFHNCTSLVTAPGLPATTLADYCYYFMFDGCTSLETAPELPATTLAKSCYRYMFAGCTSLDTAPELPATTLADYCYYFMFYNCTSLVTAPELPATDLDQYSYGGMFYDCASLVTGPDLPATRLGGNCYREMFQYCTSLTSITLLYGYTASSYITYMWVYGIATTGTLYKAGTQYSSPGHHTYPSTWTQVQI